MRKCSGLQVLFCLLGLGLLHLWQSGFQLSPAAWQGHPESGPQEVTAVLEATEAVAEESPESGNLTVDQWGSALSEDAEDGELLNSTASTASTALEQADASEALTWFLREEASDPPGFSEFRDRLLSVQKRGHSNPESVKWVVFTASIGLGNWMAGLSSALLVAGLTGRAFAWIPASMRDVCTWMDSPLCDWARHPVHVIEEAEKALEAIAANPKAKPRSKSVEVLAIDWKGCKYEKLRCMPITQKPILLLLSGVWVGNVLLENLDFLPILQQAFQRQLAAHGAPHGGQDRVILDTYGPLVRWIFPPAAAVRKETEGYVQRYLRSGNVSICVQGRSTLHDCSALQGTARTRIEPCLCQFRLTDGNQRCLRGFAERVRHLHRAAGIAGLCQCARWL
ncbi:unnamed protein product, partial [Symbiodinium sp. CCMP2592]